MADSKGPGRSSRLRARGAVDGRSREGRFLAAVRDDLTAHLGGNPSAAQRLMIDNAASLALRIALSDEALANGGEFAAHAGRTFLALANSLSRTLRALGLNASATAPPSLMARLAPLPRIGTPSTQPKERS